MPYEGELENEVSQTAGLLPVQFGSDLVVYQIAANRALGVTGEGESRIVEEGKLKREPAYGNIAELGLGVLDGFGVEPCGSTLLDEKLGLHIAFGRSDHFGGIVGVSDFSRPEAVVHIDRVYLPSVQPRVHVASVFLELDGHAFELMRAGKYAIDWSSGEV